MVLSSNTVEEQPAASSRWQMVEEIIGRALMLLWLIHVIRVQGAQLVDIVANGDGSATAVTHFANSSLMVVFSLIAFGLTLARRAPKAIAKGIEPRVTAILGSYLVLVVPLLPRDEIGVFWSSFGIALTIVGLITSGYCLSWLGRSYSIMASARKLVTGGPYNIVRHPLYACEILLMTGLVVMNFSIWAVLVEVAVILLLWRRMINEERILTQAFPEYEEYARRVPRVIPGLPSFRKPATVHG